MVELTARHLADKILGHVEVDLRARQADVSKIGGEQGELHSKIDTVFVPGQEPENGKRMPQVVEARTPASAEMSDPC